MSGYVEMTQEQLHRLPSNVQEALRMYGREETRGFGKPSRIHLTTLALRDLERLMNEATK